MWRYTSRCLCVGLSLDKEHNSIFAKRLIFPGGLFKYWWRLRKTFPVTCANFIILFFNIQQFCTSLAKRRMPVSHHDCSCRQLGLEYIALWHTCTCMGTFPYYISVFFKEVTKTQLSWDGFLLSGIGVNTPTATFVYLRWSSERCHKHWPGLEPGSNSIAEWPDKRSLNLRS